ncbi:hypothetical protein SAMN00017405_2370, partial [Desulfonispora thiosulfatigenes DSM 11270]
TGRVERGQVKVGEESRNRRNDRRNKENNRNRSRDVP